MKLTSPSTSAGRLDFLDATRAFALLLGILFHASLSFMPTFMGWATQDVSTSPLVAAFSTVSHSFRMETFFLVAGLCGCLAFQRRGAADYLRSRTLRLLGPFLIGWFLLRPLLISGWLMGSSDLAGKGLNVVPSLRDGFESLRQLPTGIFTGTHLWFLYYLALATGITIALRALAVSVGPWREPLRRGVDAVTHWLARSPFALAALILPTAAALWCMRFWAMDTPDQSLWPQGPVLAVYEGFFLLGWLLGRRPELLTHFTQLSFERVGLACVSIAGSLWSESFQMQPSQPHHAALHGCFVFCHAAMMWSLVTLVIGVFRRLCVRPRAWVRYLADSAYWLYLVHLPIVVWLQVAIADAPAHWSLKLAFVFAATTGVGLLTYDLFVRGTFLGEWLNGSKRPGVIWSLLARRKQQADQSPRPSAIIA